MTRDPALERRIPRRARLRAAERLVPPAARMEPAPWRNVPRRRSLPSKDDLLLDRSGLRNRDHRDERLGVRMLRRADDLRGGSDLDDASQVDNRDAIGDH